MQQPATGERRHTEAAFDPRPGLRRASRHDQDRPGSDMPASGSSTPEQGLCRAQPSGLSAKPCSPDVPAINRDEGGRCSLAPDTIEFRPRPSNCCIRGLSAFRHASHKVGQDTGIVYRQSQGTGRGVKVWGQGHMMGGSDRIVRQRSDGRSGVVPDLEVRQIHEWRRSNPLSAVQIVSACGRWLSHSFKSKAAD